MNVKISRKVARELIDFMTDPDTTELSVEGDKAVKEITTALDEAQGAWDNDPDVNEDTDEVSFLVEVTEE